MRLEFAPECRTKLNCDSWPSAPGVSWCGAKLSCPSLMRELVVSGNAVVLHFVSDGSNTDWGVRLAAEGRTRIPCPTSWLGH